MKLLSLSNWAETLGSWDSSGSVKTSTTTGPSIEKILDRTVSIPSWLLIL